MAVHHKNYWYYKGIALRRLHGAGHPDGRRKDEESIACFDKALTENSEHYLTWREKGQALYMLGRYEEAIPCFDEAIRLKIFCNPFDDNSATNLKVWRDRCHCNYIMCICKGVELCDQEKYEEANTYLNEAITENPKSFDAWFVKMGVLLFLERYNEGWACGVEAKSINPELFGSDLGFAEHYLNHNYYGLRGILENRRKGIPFGRKCLKSQH